MHVNTTVVKALMYLRGVDEQTLAGLAHVTTHGLRQWLDAVDESEEESVPFDIQLEILKLLGIHGDGPRSDVVHYWRLHESLFASTDSAYWPLIVMLKAFGGAQAVVVSPDQDPYWSWNAKAHFGLKFQGFVAILEVTAHPLRNITFDPAHLPDLSWVPETMGVLLSPDEYLALEPGAMKVKGLNQYLTYSSEVSHWEKLREVALERGIRAETVASLLLGTELPTALPAARSEAPAEKQEAVGPVRDDSPAPKQPSRSNETAQIASRSADDMRLFVTPVKQVPVAESA